MNLNIKNEILKLKLYDARFWIIDKNLLLVLPSNVSLSLEGFNTTCYFPAYMESCWNFKRRQILMLIRDLINAFFKYTHFLRWVGWDFLPKKTERIKLRYDERFTHAVAFSKKLPWLAQTKVITLKTQLHAVNARWKRLSQLSLKVSKILKSRISCTLPPSYKSMAILNSISLKIQEWLKYTKFDF